MDSNASNALALEYQRDYGTAHRDLNVSDLVNNPHANGVCRVFGLCFQEQRAASFSLTLVLSVMIAPIRF
jgi:hypothetical protein